jgi:hypothetical protein
MALQPVRTLDRRLRREDYVLQAAEIPNHSEIQSELARSPDFLRSSMEELKSGHPVRHHLTLDHNCRIPPITVMGAWVNQRENDTR